MTRYCRNGSLKRKKRSLAKRQRDVRLFDESPGRIVLTPRRKNSQVSGACSRQGQGAAEKSAIDRQGSACDRLLFGASPGLGWIKLATGCRAEYAIC